MSKSKLIQRLQWYYPMEKFHAFITFPALLLYILVSNPLQEAMFLAYGLLICILILYQGQHYWKLKLKKLRGEIIDNERNIKFFKASKKLNRILIWLIPFFFIVQMQVHDWSFKNNSLIYWGILANVFAVLEHINYYHTQLMIDNLSDVKYVLKNKRLKKASLARDISQGQF